MISIKLRFANEFRRFAITPATTLQEVNTFVSQRLFAGQFKPEAIVYYYLDQAEDWIKVTIDEEWAEALSFAQEYNDQHLALRLAIKQDIKPQAQQQHCKRSEQQQYCRRMGNPWLNLLHSVFAEQKQQPCQQNACVKQQQCQQKQQQPASNNLESLLQQKMGSVEKTQPNATCTIPITTLETAANVQQEAAVTDTVFVKNVEQDAAQQEVKPQEVTPVQQEPLVPTAVKNEQQEANVEQIVLEQDKQQEPVVAAATTEEAPSYQVELNILNSMGFSNVKFNTHLLNNFKGNMAKVIDALLTAKV